MFSVASSLAAYRQRPLGVAVALLALGLLGAGAGPQRAGLSNTTTPASHRADSPWQVASNASHTAGKQDTADQPSPAAGSESPAGQQQAPASEHTTARWLTSVLTAEPQGAAPQWRVPPLRPLPAFGDSTWNSAAADQSPALTLTRRQREQGESTRRLAPLWASLQAWKVRLQI